MKNKRTRFSDATEEHVPLEVVIHVVERQLCQ